eukprot:TRINITY_DN4031_c0_g1_i1.p1 TRINITY_DN4031_c0_g1~~TRINITY_DN4031_c0_g1_i1.p1  ORF type:complete len:115 (+),score=22.68 TRINITY_DN4031_c0_g1_i1:64-408(+)
MPPKLTGTPEEKRIKLERIRRGDLNALKTMGLSLVLGASCGIILGNADYYLGSLYGNAIATLGAIPSILFYRLMNLKGINRDENEEIELQRLFYYGLQICILVSFGATKLYRLL